MSDAVVYDHDFRHLANGLLVPHGVYDYFDNAGFMTLGTSRETSAFVCDAIALAWEEDRHARYSNAEEIVLTFDAGGANAARSLRFKEDLVALSARLELPLRIAHYPPYTSKWHPIEHRLFSHVERALRGVILNSHETALKAVQRTRTRTGLHVKARILDKVYNIGANAPIPSATSRTTLFAMMTSLDTGTTSSMRAALTERTYYLFLKRSLPKSRGRLLTQQSLRVSPC